MTPAISLCLICGNEAERIERCLDSAQAAFDELCLVRAVGDLPPDDTLPIARAWCERHRIQFRFAEWTNRIAGLPHVDHFGDARNAALALATGDWWCWLDCDDLVDAEFCAALRQCAAEGEYDAYQFDYHVGGGGVTRRERLLRPGCGCFTNRVHEAFALRTDRLCYRPGPAVRHAPVTLDRDSSHHRNLTLLRLEDANVSRRFFYLHEELFWLFTQRADPDARADAVAYGLAALELLPPERAEETYEILLNLGELLPDRAEEFFLRALKLQPWRREAPAYLCQRAVTLQQPDHAVSWLRMMDGLPLPHPLPWTHRQLWHGWGRNYLRVRVLRLRGQHDRAAAEHAEHLRDAAYARGVAQYEAAAPPKPAPAPATPVGHEDADDPEILVMCPTRARPDRCRQMLESFLATRRGRRTRIVCYVADDDPARAAYEALQPPPGEPPSAIRFEFGPRRTIIEVFNTLAATHAADFYAEVNDDHLYRTDGWDLKLVAALRAQGGSGMACPRLENLPSAVMVSADCVRALGWFSPPGFRHQYVDNAINDLYGAAGLLRLAPDVWIEHCHPAFGKVKADDTYAHLAASAEPDRLEYERWRRDDFARDLARLKTVAGA